MSERRRAARFAALALAIGLIAASLAAALTANSIARAQYQTLSAACERIVEALPEAEQPLLFALRDAARAPGRSADFLARHGYECVDFFQAERARAVGAALAASLVGAALLGLGWAARRRALRRRIGGLAEYLEGIHSGAPGALVQGREDEFSRLQDEIYKAVSSLYQTRDDALAAKRGFAENLSNIAHQLKTPITAMSLALQELRAHPSRECAEQIERQLSRLTGLEEALLLLARADAGALPLERRDVDVFTVLTLASDNLREISRRKRVSIDVPELGAVGIRADLEWTMEAIMNLLRNCVEHAPAGSAVHCDYAQNPIYTVVRIWDEGRGFPPGDLPHLFERFYRGENAAPGGVGIGLSLAKEILEMQGGALRAENLPGGGACFEIRFYRH